MDNADRERIIATIQAREVLRPLGRLERLLRKPFRTFPYYVLAALGHIRPFKLSFRTLWNTSMTSYLPEGNTFYYYGYCEANLASFLLRYVKSGTVMVDIGAHVGYYSMLFSELVGNEGQVHSFEPTPWTFALLSENVRELMNVTANNLAVSDSPKELTFSDYGPGYGAFNTAHAQGAAGLAKEPVMTRVNAVTLDAYCAEKSLSPDLVKIDAEGFEYHVLNGMEGLCTGSTRPLITLEVAGDDIWKENLADSFTFLKEHGYRAYDIATDGSLTPHAVRETYTYDNLLFVPDERASDIASLLS